MRSGGESKSGNPCDKFIALHSPAKADITVNIVVPTLGSLDFIPGLETDISIFFTDCKVIKNPIGLKKNRSSVEYRLLNCGLF